MKFITDYLIICTLLITSLSCNNSTTTEPEITSPTAAIGTTTSSTESTTAITPPSENKIETTLPAEKAEEKIPQSSDDFIKIIEADLANLKKEKRKEGECHIEKYTSSEGQIAKVKTSCYDGNVYLCKVERYYKNGNVYLAKVYHEKYNTSPFDKENFDESKSVITQRLVFFKNGNLKTIDKILDENNKVASLEGNLEMGWEQAISF